MKIKTLLAAGLVMAAAPGLAGAQHRHGGMAGKAEHPHVDAQIEIKLLPQWSYRSSFGPATSRRVVSC